MDVYQWVQRCVHVGGAVKWLECEDAHLRKHWKRRKPEQLAGELGRLVSAVKRRARELGLGKGRQPDYRRGYVAHSVWTAEDDALMLGLIGTVSDEELVRRTGRTLGAIESRIGKLSRPVL